jgi:ABC-2 type transport system permease protein
MHTLRRYGFVLRTAARQQWIYRGEMAMRIVAMAIYMGVFIALWSTAFAISGQSELAGYTLAEIIWYLGMAETVILSASRIFTEISDAVKSGDLAYTLARPMSYPFYQVANSLGKSVPGFGLNLLTAAAVVTVGTGRLPILNLTGGEAVGSPSGLTAFLVMATLALLIDALIAVMIGMLAFWIEEVLPAFWIYQKLLFTAGGLFLPLELFPERLQRIVRWLPFRFIAYAPARAFVAFEPNPVLRMMGGQVAYVVALAALLALVWRRARRRLVLHGG